MVVTFRDEIGLTEDGWVRLALPIIGAVFKDQTAEDQLEFARQLAKELRQEAEGGSDHER